MSSHPEERLPLVCFLRGWSTVLGGYWISWLRQGEEGLLTLRALDDFRRGITQRLGERVGTPRAEILPERFKLRHLPRSINADCVAFKWEGSVSWSIKLGHLRTSQVVKEGRVI